MDFSALNRFIEEGFPFHAHLGVKVDSITKGLVRLCIPFRECLVGHAAKSFLHGGVISSLVDICGGFAVWTCCNRDDNIVTITLSVDYLRPALPGDLYAEATIRMLGNKVGNAHVVVWSAGDEGQYVAEGRGVYNIKRSTKKEPEKPRTR